MSAVTLGLFSASRLNGEPCGCDLVFYVEPSGQSGVVSRTECWGGKTISALRDRLIIEWFFNTCPGATKELENMVSGIADLIKRKTEPKHEHSADQVECKAKRCYIRIGIVCRNGAHLSVCFVERLYDYFTFERLYQYLTVERDHWDALSGQWGKNKDFVWQQSVVPVRHPIVAVRDLLKERMWQSLIPCTSFELEEAFRRNPFDNGVEIGDEVFNFQEGSVYSKRKKKTYRIRCTVLKGASDKITCRHLKHDQYISLTKDYRGAGILFYSVHPDSGEAVFLLGHITYCYSDWCDFGGLKNRMEVPRYTAARECCEETLGVLGRTKHLVQCLENYEANNTFKVVNENTKYVSHFLRVPYDDYPSHFQQAVARHKRAVEVDEMRGVQYVLQNHYNILVEPINKDGCIDTTTRLPLRIEFAQTLCIADKLGILDSIEHITRELHIQQQQASIQAKPYISLPGPQTREGLKPKPNVSSTKEQQSHEVANSANTCLLHPLETSSTGEDLKTSGKEMDTLSKLMEAASIAGASESKEDSSHVTANNSLTCIGNKDRSKCSGGDDKDIVAAASIDVSSQSRQREGKSDRLKSEPSASQKKTKAGHVLYFGMGAGFFKGDDSCYDI